MKKPQKGFDQSAVSAYNNLVRRWSPDTTEGNEMHIISVTLRWKKWSLTVSIFF